MSSEKNRKMELLQLEIPTSRLLLQTISMKYKEDIFREFNQQITTYMYTNPPKNISDTEDFINDSLLEIKKGENLVLVILNKNSFKFLGCTGIHEINSNEPELGIWLKKSAHGKGYGLETIIGLKTWAEKNLDFQHLVYCADKANIPSRRIPEKLGGKIIREYKKTNLSGKVLNILEYVLPKVGD